MRSSGIKSASPWSASVTTRDHLQVCAPPRSALCPSPTAPRSLQPTLWLGELDGLGNPQGQQQFTLVFAAGLLHSAECLQGVARNLLGSKANGCPMAPSTQWLALPSLPRAEGDKRQPSAHVRCPWVFVPDRELREHRAAPCVLGEPPCIFLRIVQSSGTRSAGSIQPLRPRCLLCDQHKPARR